jgi:hypothetical protein
LEYNSSHRGLEHNRPNIDLGVRYNSSLIEKG